MACQRSPGTTCTMHQRSVAPQHPATVAVRRSMQCHEVAKKTLPRGFGIDWAGISADEVARGNEAIYIFLICLGFVYLFLAAQYESFLLPFAVILSLPAGIFGAFLLLKVIGPGK